MAYRTRLKVTKNGVPVFNQQLLGNNESFSREELKTIGVYPDVDWFVEETEVDLDEFIKMFQNYHIDKFKSWTSEEWDLVIKDSLCNIESTFHAVPSYTVIGNYAVLLHQLHIAAFGGDARAYYSAG